MLDSDLATIYGVPTKRLNEQVRRNRSRFPPDFMFRLSEKETGALRSHLATSKASRGGRRYRPYVFTEHGAVMLSSVLSSPLAVRASIMIARAFVKLRRLVAAHRELAKRLDALERSSERHDGEIRGIISVIRELTSSTEQPRRRIGFEP